MDVNELFNKVVELDNDVIKIDNLGFIIANSFFDLNCDNLTDNISFTCGSYVNLYNYFIFLSNKNIKHDEIDSSIRKWISNNKITYQILSEMINVTDLDEKDYLYYAVNGTRDFDDLPYYIVQKIKTIMSLYE